MTDSWSGVETYTGGTFDIFDPDPDDVRLRDIGAGLARTCRFGGHCRHFYSVAQHSLYVSSELPSDDPHLQLYGLLHDGGEAYVGDIPRPIKAEFEAVERIEEQVLDAIWTAFDLRPPTADEWERVMAADDRLLSYEASNILADGSWADGAPDLGYDLRSDSIKTVRRRFCSRAEELLDAVDQL